MLPCTAPFDCQQTQLLLVVVTVWLLRSYALQEQCCQQCSALSQVPGTCDSAQGTVWSLEGP